MAPTGDDADQRRPRIAIMGEFSAGKSTLTNLLLGDGALPVQVTATQLPPVWIAYGDGPPVQVDMDGNERPVDLYGDAPVSVHDVQFVRVFHQAEVLEMCDLIDMPGISDPNMPADIWDRMANEVDGVIWCTHAGQAWRQSEEAVWSHMPPELYARSLLLITRFDKIVEERDRKRVVARVKRETEDMFRGVFPISLTEALDAGGDDALWAASGADAFANAMIALAQSLGGATQRYAPNQDAPAPIPMRPATPEIAQPATTPAVDATSDQVMPQRVRSAAAGGRSMRPARPDPDQEASPF
ncbi:MAG: dynamin family protein [Pseudomonadota bacterium]